MYKTEWEAMKNIAVTEVDSSKLVDCRNIENNTGLPKSTRIKNYIKQLNGNPYFYKYDIYIVKESFTETDSTINDLLEISW